MGATGNGNQWQAAISFCVQFGGRKVMVLNRNGKLVEAFMCFQSSLGNLLHPTSLLAVDKDDGLCVSQLLTFQV